MNSFPRLLLALSLLVPAGLRAATDDFKAPDSLVLKNGTVVSGLIINNSRDAVVLQEREGERSYPKEDIVRIRDNENIGVEYTDIPNRGELPAWRVIANDLRTRDAIRRLVEIPATIIDNGEFKNVPYMSFRVNENVELNIYGDPEDPAGLELGIYGSRGDNPKYQKILRTYLAGFLTTREEVAALYAIGLKEGIKQAGDLTIEVTPKTAPDAYGAWWISLYNKKKLEQVRLDDKEYARLTRPVDEVVDKKGRVISSKWNNDELRLSRKKADGSKVLLRGFYRDKNGDFRLITEPAAGSN